MRWEDVIIKVAQNRASVEEMDWLAEEVSRGALDDVRTANHPRAPGEPILGHVCKYGTERLVRALLEAGADPETTSTDGRFQGRLPLLSAASHGNLQVAQVLLEFGADVNAQATASGFSALMLAAGAGHAEMVEYLLSSGADPRLTSVMDETALDFAYRCRDDAGFARKDPTRPERGQRCIDILESFPAEPGSDLVGPTGGA